MWWTEWWWREIRRSRLAKEIKMKINWDMGYRILDIGEQKD
jgi:hypothetical protein